MEFLSSVLLLVVCILLLWYSTRRPKGLPPGPPRLPLIGNLLNINRDIRVMTDKLRRQYGDIMSIYVFNKPFIFLTGYDVIREALVKNGESLTRAKGFGHNYLTFGKGLITSSDNIWKEQRRVVVKSLRDLGMGKSILEYKILEESDCLIEEFQNQDGQPFDCSPFFSNAVSNIVCSIVSGKRFAYTDKKFKQFRHALDVMSANIQRASVFGEVPFLVKLPGDLFGTKRTVESYRFIENTIVKPSIQEHLSLGEDSPNDLISDYIKKMRLLDQEQVETSLGTDHLTQTIVELISAGIDSTSTALQWLLVFMLNFPDVQEKCFQEIKENIGLNRSPSMTDKTSLPYLEATILETLRLGEITPTTFPYSASEDLNFRGYIIPKGLTIVPMLQSVLVSKDIWGDPLTFRPERFLNEEGTIVRHEKFIPFSLGRRACFGESLARMELFLFLTTMIQRFKFVVDKEKPSMEGVNAITNTPKPFTLKAILR